MHTIVTHYAVVNLLGCINRHIIVSTQHTNSLDMVCVVVRHKDVLYLIQFYIVVMQVLLQCSHPDTCIYQ